MSFEMNRARENRKGPDLQESSWLNTITQKATTITWGDSSWDAPMCPKVTQDKDGEKEDSPVNEEACSSLEDKSTTWNEEEEEKRFRALLKERDDILSIPPSERSSNDKYRYNEASWKIRMRKRVFPEISVKPPSVPREKKKAADRARMATHENKEATRKRMATAENMAATRERMTTDENKAATRERMATEENIAATRERMASEKNKAATRERMATEENKAATRERMASEKNKAATRERMATEENKAATRERMATEENKAATRERMATERNKAATRQRMATEANRAADRQRKAAKTLAKDKAEKWPQAPLSHISSRESHSPGSSKWGSAMRPTCILNENLTLIVSVKCFPAPTFIWKKDSNVIGKEVSGGTPLQITMKAREAEPVASENRSGLTKISS